MERFTRKVLITKRSYYTHPYGPLLHFFRMPKRSVAQLLLQPSSQFPFLLSVFDRPGHQLRKVAEQRWSGVGITYGVGGGYLMAPYNSDVNGSRLVSLEIKGQCTRKVIKLI